MGLEPALKRVERNKGSHGVDKMPVKFLRQHVVDLKGSTESILSNILLDELDKELEKRGHKFVRYADDCNIYVKTKRAGERVMASVKTFIEETL